MKKQHLLYGIRNNKLVHISEVEKGIKCDCTCPACKGRLIAKKGNKVIHHFAHYNADECEYGYQTSLHLAAKEILLNAKEIFIPALFLKIPFSNRYPIKIVDTQMVKIDNVEVEKTQDNIIPDVIVYSLGRKFYVEIFVTHAIDEDKLKKIKKSKISTIEIDLSKIDREITDEELKHFILDDCEEKSWKYNVNTELWLEKFKMIADKKAISARGMAQHIDYCPVKMRTYRGKPYANFIDDCIYCEYYFGDYDNGILCTGSKMIATKEDYLNYIKNNNKNIIMD